MLRFICDTPDRITSRLYLRLGTTVCPCCNFWRGVIFGGSLMGAAWYLTPRVRAVLALLA